MTGISWAERIQQSFRVGEEGKGILKKCKWRLYAVGSLIRHTHNGLPKNNCKAICDQLSEKKNFERIAGLQPIFLIFSERSNSGMRNFQV